MHSFCWTSKQEAWLDQSDTKEFGRVVLGRLGGMTQAGQTKNEDGFLLFTSVDWEFMLLMDAHNSAASADLVAAAFQCPGLSMNGKTLWERSLDKSDVEFAEELLLTL